MEKPNITVVIPVRNEEKFIEKCIKSILKQTYPHNNIKVVFCDGMSTDQTRNIILRYQNKYPLMIEIIENKQKIVPVALNLCIKKLNTDYLIRLDAHSDYPNDYFEKCIETIIGVQADNIGGLTNTVGDGLIGETFAQVLSSKFGVGNSGFRTGAKSGYVDTVPFGTFKRTTFQKFGLFNALLARNQDYEYNYRIRKNGGKVYLNSDIQLNYHCKDTISGILRQSMENGKWNVITMKLCPKSMSLRHFIPLLFLVSLIIFSIIGIIFGNFLLLLLEVSTYFILDLFFSIKNGEKRYGNHFFTKLLMFPLFHLSYGFGSLLGLCRLKKIVKGINYELI